MAIIPKRELEGALRDYRWLLIYGRRKTGKTFYVREGRIRQISYRY